MFDVTRLGTSLRNVNVSCTKARRSEVQPQSAQRTPSTCAARVWEQMSHFDPGMLMIGYLIKSDAMVDEILARVEFRPENGRGEGNSLRPVER